MSPHVSASQVSRARGCLRRWAWERVAPVPPKLEHESRLQVGRDVHAVAEAYHKSGQAPDRSSPAGRVFLPALPYLPPPRSGQAELQVFLYEPDFVGYVDLLAPARDMPGFPAGPEWVVLDYKTKDSFSSKGMFTGPGDLLTDVQALVYSTWFFRANPDQTCLGLRWLYLRVSGRPAARVCDAILTREQVQEAYERLVRPTAERLIALRSKPLEPLTLEPNPLECTRYGARYACPYISRCQLTPAQKLEGAMNMGLLEDLRAKHGNKNQTETKPAQAVATPIQDLTAQAKAAKGVNPPEGKPAQSMVGLHEGDKTEFPRGETEEYADEQVLQAVLRALARRISR